MYFHSYIYFNVSHTTLINCSLWKKNRTLWLLHWWLLLTPLNPPFPLNSPGYPKTKGSKAINKAKIAFKRMAFGDVHAFFSTVRPRVRSHNVTLTVFLSIWITGQQIAVLIHCNNIIVLGVINCRSQRHSFTSVSFAGQHSTCRYNKVFYCPWSWNFMIIMEICHELLKKVSVNIFNYYIFFIRLCQMLAYKFNE